MYPLCRTLPRVRELKLGEKALNDQQYSRTLPRVRELKRLHLLKLLLRERSHPSQGA